MEERLADGIYYYKEVKTMLFSRSKLEQLYILLEQKGNLHFSVSTQYKLLKIKKILREEIEIYNEQITSLSNFFEKDDLGNLIKNQNGFKIKDEYLEQCKIKINELNNSQISLPDIYFSLDELEPLSLTLNELELLEPFIKN